MALEVLLCLRSHGDDPVTAGALSRELRIPEEAAAAHLEEFSHLRLARAEGAQPRSYRYAAARDIGRTVDELADAYARRKTSVISLIYSKPSDQVQSFADAFRIRRREDD